jgi:ATP-dependent DNA helicase RecG
LESLKRHHISRPRNPLIADVCFKAGYIDSWGRGTLKIYEACKEEGLPEPEIISMDGGILVTLFKNLNNQVTPQVTPQVEGLIKLLKGEMNRQELQEELGLLDRENFRTNYLQPALEKGFIEMTVPDKPNSRLQKYRLTVLGERMKKE